MFIVLWPDNFNILLRSKPKSYTFVPEIYADYSSGVLNLWGIPHLWGMASCQVGNFAFAFGATMYGSYPRVAVAALALLVAFPSTYQCESAFSSMVQIKTKSRNRLIDLESDLRCAISKVEPKIEALVQAKQMQKSH